jgi:PPK2 family polyphosphate:nucleotide phosphotransferase
MYKRDPKILIGRREMTNFFRFEPASDGKRVTLMPLDTEVKVEPRSSVDLGRIDTGPQGLYEPEEVLPKLRALSKRLAQLQYLIYAERKHSLLILLQGLDASGKDGAIGHLAGAMNPMGCQVVAFKEPKPEELDHDFLWRVHPHLPGRGKVVIFNRSHYEDVLVVRVHRQTPPDFWLKRYELINNFERMAAVENNTVILKFFLHISKKEQLARFKQRLDDPARQWKVSEADYRERAHWDDYTEAFEDVLRFTSTEYAPWFVIPSDQKWFRDLTIAEIVVQKLEELNMRWPEPSADISGIRRRYHSLKTEEDDV